mgnify:CR=1 FL=1
MTQLRWTFLLPTLGATLATAACDESSPNAHCDPAATNPCGPGETCVAVRRDAGECHPLCDPYASTTTCPDGTTCVPTGPDTGACTPTCNPSADDPCGADWACVPAGDRGSICRPLCTPDGAACPAGEVCQPLDDGRAACILQCSPDDPDSCQDDRSCERRTDGAYACYDPVLLAGRVFDLVSDDGVPGARVIAADQTGAAATNVAVTGADGAYQLAVPVTRQPDGTLAPGGGTFSLRVTAQDYENFPHGVRVALPIDAAALAVAGDGRWTVRNAATDVGLIPLPPPTRERGSIAGRVLADSPGGVLIVANSGSPNPPLAWTDRSGEYVVFNAEVGAYVVMGYKAFLQLQPASTTVEVGQDVAGVDLRERPDTPTGAISGTVQLVNPGACRATSVVLVPEETYDDTLKRGEVATGLRAPAPPAAPNITGAWVIDGVPDGSYAVLAAFENDACVRDPDPGIAGTQVLHITVPDRLSGTRSFMLDGSFKVTGALAILDPGETGPEAVDPTPTFRWADDSSEDAYDLVVYDAFGNEVWHPDPLPGVSGGTPELTYAGPALQPGMYYQFRVTSLRRGGSQPISMTEDLLGVFFLE